MKRALVLCGLLAGCAIGAPPGFSDGDAWTFPLVAPLENDLLLVPVYVQDKKEPLLFMIDPDSRESAIDAALHSELKPYTVQIPDEVTEGDTLTTVFIAELRNIKVGDLEVRNLKVRVVPAGRLVVGGRPVRGILGRDVIAESLILSIDRNRGVAHLATQGSIKPKPGSEAVSFRSYYGRRIADVLVNDQSYRLHLDLGARFSSLWGSLFERAGLAAKAADSGRFDEYLQPYAIDRAGVAQSVALGEHTHGQAIFIPFGDKRLDKEDIDGAIGQNVLSKYDVTLNWHHEQMWLLPRSTDLLATAGDRLRRFGTAFASCENPACVTVEIVREAAPASASPSGAGATESSASAAVGVGVNDSYGGLSGAAEGEATYGIGSISGTLPESAGEPTDVAPATSQVALARDIRVTREAAMVGIGYEVTLLAVDATGAPLGMPLVRFSLPPGEAEVGTGVPPFAASYSVADHFVVVDVSPFPAPCADGPAGKVCVAPLADAPQIRWR